MTALKMADDSGILEFEIGKVTHLPELRTLRFLLSDESQEVKLPRHYIKKARRVGNSVAFTTETGLELIMHFRDDSTADKVKTFYD